MNSHAHHHGKKRRAFWGASPSVLAAALAAFAALPAQAQTQDSNGTVQLGPIRVEDENAKTLNQGTGLSTLPSTIQDTPQAITVITQEQMKQQGVTSLSQALRNVPGITVAIGEGGQLNGDQFKIRGIDAKDDVYVDGLRDFGVYTRDSFDYETVQVLQGPSGTTFGRSGAGGAINTVSKTPFLDDLTSGDVFIGNGAYYRALADVNFQIDDTTAIRINGMLNANHVVDRDLIKSDRWGIAPSIGFGLGTNLSYTVNYLHQHDNRMPDYGVPILADTRAGQPVPAIGIPASEYDVPRSNFYGFTSDYDISDVDIVTGRLRYQSGDFTLTNDFRVGFYSRKFTPTPPDSCNAIYCMQYFYDGNPATAPRVNIGGPGPYSQRSWGLQDIAALTYDGEFAGHRHQAQIGFDGSYQTNKRNFFNYALDATCGVDPAQSTGGRPCSKDLYDPSHAPYYHVVPATSGNATGDGRSSDIALFASERFWITPEWSVLGGLRWDSYKSRYQAISTTNVASTLESNNNLFNPKVSIIFEPTETQTYYVSYAKSSVPQGTSIANSGSGGSITAATQDLEPEENESYEAGIKYGFFNGNLAATLSVFDVKKNNATQADPITGETLAQSGEKQNVRGITLGVNGNVTKKWTLNAAYTYLDSEIKQSFVNCTAAPSPIPATAPTGVVCPTGVATSTPLLNTALIGLPITYTPKHAASLWTNYDLDDWLKGLSVGGGVTYQSKLNMRYTAVSNSYADRTHTHLTAINEVPDSVSFDGVVAYTAGPYRIAVNAYNITDRLNYTQVYTNRAVPAAGRTVILSLGLSY